MPNTKIAQHTPGPWKRSPFYIYVLDQDDALKIIADCVLSEDFQPRMSTGEKHANACLIAAAPDLLAAARLAVIELGFVKNAEVESNALTDLRTAIAKVEGREP